MATLTAGTIIGRARTIFGDSDTTNQGVSDTLLFEILDELYKHLWAINPRPVSRSATTLGLNSIAAATKSVLASSTDILQWIGLYREAAATDIVIGAPLKMFRPDRILQLQNEDSTQGTVTRYSTERAATVTEADQGKWLVRLHPIPSGTTHISARVVAECETITTSAQGLDVTDEDANALVIQTALRAAPMIEQPPGRINEIRQTLPARYRLIWEQPVPVQPVAGET